MILIPVLILGQDWAPIGAKWYYDHHDGLQAYLTVIESKEDTLIKNINCKILETSRIDEKSDDGIKYYWDTLLISRDFLYYSNDSIFHFDEFSRIFYPLYVFNVSQNDTIIVREGDVDCNQPDYYCSKFEYVVDSIGSIHISDKDLDLIYNSHTETSDWVFNMTWNLENRPIIEIIGSTKFLFGAYRNSVLEGDILCLRCYNDKNINYKSDYWDKSCDYLRPLSGSNSMTIARINDVAIYPNPFDDYISLESKGYNQINYEVYDINGRLLVYGNDSKINTGQFASGTYFLHIIFDDTKN
jgi:hypothetical protein